MKLIDLIIIGIYLAVVIGIGFYVRRRAARSMDAYYLGDKTLPWYMLGLSNASGMFDISGTMWLVTLTVVYGLKSIWIPWLWPVFNQVFLMVYLSTWLRRSNVLTGASWIESRFGDGRGGQLSQYIIVAFALVSVLGFLAYGFIGIGKFIEIFLPWDMVAPIVPFEVAPENVATFYGIAFTSIATLYVMMGGMFGVVMTDLVQFTIMTIAAVIIAVIAMTSVDAAALAAATPEGWSNPFFGWELGLDWQSLRPELASKVASDGYTLFGVFFMMLLFKGVLVSAAGPAPNYDMQKILATRSPREAALMSGFVSVVLMPIRYLMIAGFAVLALVYFDQLNLGSGSGFDSERILPAAILEFVPAGVLGLILAGLIAAFMSTFAATVNAAPAYLVNDIYRRRINPGASRKTLITLSYLVSIGVVVISTIIGLFIPSINAVLQWIVSGLWGGYTAANVLKWYWWRFNGYGFFFGMLVGIIGALLLPPIMGSVFPDLARDILPLYSFPVLLLLSSAACVIASLATAPDADDVLIRFYRSVRPWGFWGPVRDKVLATDPSFTVNKNFGRDMFNVAIGIIMQTALVAIPVYVVIKEWGAAAIVLTLIVACALVLKQSWYRRLPTE